MIASGNTVLGVVALGAGGTAVLTSGFSTILAIRTGNIVKSFTFTLNVQ